MTCPHCHGTGIISRPYIVGMPGGDLHTMMVCGCDAKRPALAKTAQEGQP